MKYFQDIQVFSLTQSSTDLVSVLSHWDVAFGFCLTSLIKSKNSIFDSKQLSMSPFDFMLSGFQTAVLNFSFLT